jgi:hypothetical protein
MGLDPMTKFIAVPGEGGVFQQSFLQQLVSIHFPAGKLVRVSYTGSGPGTNVGKPTIVFPFGTLETPVLNLVLSSTGVIPDIVDPPSDAMIANLYAWSVLNDEGNFVYYNTGRVQSRFGSYSPVIINSPGFQGIPTFSDTHIVVWFYRFAHGASPAGPLDPALENPPYDGGVLAVFDPSQTSELSVGQILAEINAVADQESTQALPIGDGGDLTKGEELVAALFSGSHLDPSAGGPNTYVVTTLTSNGQEISAGWGLLAALFNTKDGAFVPAPLATVSDFDVGQSVPAVLITLDVDTTKDTLTESKN